MEHTEVYRKFICESIQLLIDIFVFDLLMVTLRHSTDTMVSSETPDSVSDFYNGSVVLITGGTGFLGKVLIEKLLRVYEIKKIYLIIRTKNDMDCESRLVEFFKESV